MSVRIALLLALTLVAAPARALDVEPWARVLSAHARGGGFDYAALANDPDRRADLERFVASLASMREDEPLGAWIDAYNALVIASVMERRPLASVRDVPGFFDRITHRVAGRARTLDDIEHRIIRERFRDARVHVALVCGARSCPPLRAQPYARGTIGDTLEEVSEQWLRSGRAYRIDDQGRLHVSAIFVWFRADFERDQGSVHSWIRARVPVRSNPIPEPAPLVEMPYDWRLNEP